MNFNIPITRGARKYNFDDMKIGEHRPFAFTTTSNAITCFNQYAKTRKLTWKCSCYKQNGLIYVVRIK